MYDAMRFEWEAAKKQWKVTEGRLHGTDRPKGCLRPTFARLLILGRVGDTIVDMIEGTGNGGLVVHPSVPGGCTFLRINADGDSIDNSVEVTYDHGLSLAQRMNHSVFIDADDGIGLVLLNRELDLRRVVQVDGILQVFVFHFGAQPRLPVLLLIFEDRESPG